MKIPPLHGENMVVAGLGGPVKSQNALAMVVYAGVWNVGDLFMHVGRKHA